MKTIDKRVIKAYVLDLPTITVELKEYQSMGVKSKEYIVEANGNGKRDMLFYSKRKYARDCFKNYRRADFERNAIPSKN